MARAVTIAAIALVLSACHESSVEPPPIGSHHSYFATAIASAPDSATGDTLTCEVFLNLPPDVALGGGWAGEVRLQLTRLRAAGGTNTFADTTVDAQQVQATWLDTDSLRVVLASPIVDTLITTRDPGIRKSYTGPWVCRPELPLGRVFRQPIAGRVVIEEMLPID
ncbi:MAG TPA: hypothetical protein VFS44_08820 [Gemmatimonadaceae bacterium]|nr:hypothetical protein [Gemmatimonadaceae bacterium]